MPQTADAPAREDACHDPREQAILALLVKPGAQRPWSMHELTLEIGDAIAVEDCVRQLQAYGLAHRLGDFVWASRAALAAEDLLKPPDVITDDLILAALYRAECHRGYQGTPDWEVQEHLAVSRRSKKGRLVKARLPELAQAGFLETGRKHGVGIWALTAKGRKRLNEVPEAMASLPESPQHRKWRDAKDAAEHEIERFYLSLRDSVDAAADLLSTPMPPGPSSDAWFEVGERLHRACRQLGSATYCLHEWAEPPEDKAGPDDHSAPSDARYPPDERRRRQARRAGRRNPRWWDDSQSSL